MSTNQGWSQTPPPPPQPSGGSNGVIIVLVVVGALLLLCCGGAGGLLWFGYQRAQVALEGFGNPPEFQNLQDLNLTLDPANLAGEWRDTDLDAIYTISVQNGTPQLMSIVDDDGEVFVVEESRWDGFSLSFRYRVPSTGYVVSENAHSSGPDSLSGSFTNEAPDGTQSGGDSNWEREGATAPPVSPAGPSELTPTDPAALAAAFDGPWVCLSNQAVYTIRNQNNEPRLMSIVDDDGEVFVIQESSWDGTNLRWKYQVPSTDYVVEETVHMVNTGSLEGEYTSTGADGEVQTSTDSWIKQ